MQDLNNEVTEIFPEHWNEFPNIANVDTCYKFDIHVDRGENINWMVGLRTMNLFAVYVPGF